MTDSAPSKTVACHECPWRQSAVFNAIAADDLAAIGAAKKTHLTLGPGRTVVRRGPAPVQVFTLFSGWAFRYAMVNGGRQILTFCLPGDLIAAQARLTGGLPYSVQTLTEAAFCVFDAEEVERLAVRHPRVGLEIARIVAAEAALMEVHVASIGRRSGEARVAYLIAELYVRMRQRRMTDGLRCRVPLTQEHVADALGLSNVHVSRMLKAIADSGVARLDRGELTIFDLDGLKRRAEITTEIDFPRPSLL